MKIKLAWLAAAAAVLASSDARIMHHSGAPPAGYAMSTAKIGEETLLLNFFLKQPAEGVKQLEALMNDRSDPTSQ